MPDPSMMYLSDETMRTISVIANAVSAVLIFFLSRAITPQASLQCPLAAIRLFQRYAMCALSISLMFNAYYIVSHDRTPSIAAVAVNVFFVIVVLISAARHYMAPPIPASNTWRRRKGGWSILTGAG